MRELTAAASREAALLTRARRRDPAAVDALYVAHVVDARRLALRLAGASLADDLVADSFARVISQLHAGRGPSEDFRSYLLATIRNRFRDVQRRARRERPVSHQAWILEDGVDPVAGPEASLERSVEDDRVAAAFDTLPEDWREVLWHVELRGRPVPEAAELMGLSPAAVSSLAYRAREGLRLAFLDQLLDDPRVEDRECRWVRERLSRYLRDRVSDRVGRRVEHHLGECRACSSTTDALSRANRRLAALLLPAFLAFPAKLAAVPAGGSAAAGTAAEVSTWSSVAALKSGAVAAVAVVGVTASTLSSVPAETARPSLAIAPAAQVVYVAHPVGDRAVVTEPGPAPGRREALPTARPARVPRGLPVPGSPRVLPQRPLVAPAPDCATDPASAHLPSAIGAVLGTLTAPLGSADPCAPDPPLAVLEHGAELVRGILDQVNGLLPVAVADLARGLTDVLLPDSASRPVAPETGPSPSPATAPHPSLDAAADRSPRAPADGRPDAGAGTPPETSAETAVPSLRPSSAHPPTGALEDVAESGRDLLETVIDCVEQLRGSGRSRSRGESLGG